MHVPDARLISIKPWDRSAIPAIEKAINEAGITRNSALACAIMDIVPMVGDNSSFELIFPGETALSLAVRPHASRRAKISALGTYVPPRLLTNKDLEKMVETSDEWIYSRVGIRERHLVEPGMATSDMAVEAAKRCLADRGIEASEVEVIIVATVTPDMFFPATACLVQDKLGAKGAWGFDLSAACSGFVYALQMGAKLVESGAHSKVLVIGADTMSSIIDYTDRSTCVLFGDGAGAVLVEPAEDERGRHDRLRPRDRRLRRAGPEHARGGSLHPSTAETVRNTKCTTFTRTDRRSTNLPCARWSKPQRKC